MTTESRSLFRSPRAPRQRSTRVSTRSSIPRALLLGSGAPTYSTSALANQEKEINPSAVAPKVSRPKTPGRRPRASAGDEGTEDKGELAALLLRYQPELQPARHERSDAEGEERQGQRTRKGPEHYTGGVLHPPLRIFLGQGVSSVQIPSSSHEAPRLNVARA